MIITWGKVILAVVVAIWVAAGYFLFTGFGNLSTALLIVGMIIALARFVWIEHILNKIEKKPTDKK